MYTVLPTTYTQGCTQPHAQGIPRIGEKLTSTLSGRRSTIPVLMRFYRASVTLRRTGAILDGPKKVPWVYRISEYFEALREPSARAMGPYVRVRGDHIDLRRTCG